MDAGCNRGAAHARLWIALWLLPAIVGCSLSRPSTVWYPPHSPSPAHKESGYVASAEADYSAGIAADEAGDPAAIDYYYAAATGAWPLHVANATVPGDAGSELYRAAVRKLLDAAARFGRFDSTRGITLGDGQQVPVRYFGFLWEPADFRSMLPVGSYASRELTHRYASSGVGVEYVVLTGDVPRRPFTGSKQPLAATAVLEPDSAPTAGGFSLNFYDPSHTAATDTGLPLARDLTAPIAYAATQDTSAWIEDFLDPADNDAGASLRMTVPYQPGTRPLTRLP